LFLLGQTLGIALGVVGGLTLICMFVSCLIYQILHRRSEIAHLHILGSWNEITKAQSAIIKVIKKMADDKGSHTSLDTRMIMEKPQQYPQTITALFRGARVILRICEPNQLQINRIFLNEVKIVRTIQNDNVAKLVGLCTGPHRVAVMYAFCAKGSLTVS
jgi:hypothetical protein